MPAGRTIRTLRSRRLLNALAAVRADADVLVGPWTGEVGFELLYWIPFLDGSPSKGLAGVEWWWCPGAGPLPGIVTSLRATWTSSTDVA